MEFSSNEKKEDYYKYKRELEKYKIRLETIINAMLEAESAGMLGLYEYLGSQYNETVSNYYDTADKISKHITECRKHQKTHKYLLPVFAKDYKQEFRLYVHQGEE